MFDISLLQRIGPLLAKQQWPGLYLHALLSYSYLRVLVTLLTLSLSLYFSPSLSLRYSRSLLFLYYSYSVYSTLCHSVLAWCLCNWDCIFRWRGTRIIAQAVFPLHSFCCWKFSSSHKLTLKQCGEQAQAPLTTRPNNTALRYVQEIESKFSYWIFKQHELLMTYRKLCNTKPYSCWKIFWTVEVGRTAKILSQVRLMLILGIFNQEAIF